MTIVWTAEGRESFDRIRTRLYQFSEAAAQRWANAVIRRVDMLEVFPFLGRVVPEYGLEQVRELIIGEYRIWYWVSDEERIEILGVLHGHQSMGG